MTYREAVQILKLSGVADAEYDAAEIFCHYEGVERSVLLSDRDRNFEAPMLEIAIKMRGEREPLQYILGEWEFFGLPFEVNNACLCPRGDTEVTVEEVLNLLPTGARVLELCTGSGCIPVALCHCRHDIFAVSTDVFDETLAVAKRNAVKNGVAERISFVRSDLFARDLAEGDQSFDAIVSNPPYIPTKDIDGLSPEVRKEPRAALDGGADGLDFYREIIGYYKRYLKPDGFIALEIGYDQGGEIIGLCNDNGFDCKIVKDLGGNDRCAVCRPKNKERKKGTKLWNRTKNV